MHSRRRIVVGSVLALIVYALFYVFLDWGGPAIVEHALLHPRKDELSFQFQLCHRGAGVAAPAPPAMTWEDARTLRITAAAVANCGANWFFGDYAIRGNTIRLDYTALVPQPYLCDCEHQATYRIRNLAKKDYRLEVTAQPEVVTGWMVFSLIGGTILIVALVGVAYAAATLVARRFGRSKLATMLVILLAISVIANMLLWYAAGSLMFSSMASENMNRGILVSLGQKAGRKDADRDFALGMPRWYVMEVSEGMPEALPGRTLSVLDGVNWEGESYWKSYVDAYNWRMDKHIPPPKIRGGQGKKK